MAVTEQFPITSALANGVTTVFPFGWTLLSADDMVVQATVGGVTTTYPSSDYTISGIGSSSGSVTFLVAPASGVVITMYRDTKLVRETDYQDNGDLLADSINLDFDRPWMAMQDILTGGKAAPSAIRVPNGETVNVLPAAASRAGYFLGFDGSGQPILLAATAGTAAALSADLANSSDALKGDVLIGVKNAAANAVGTTQHEVNQRKVDVFDFMTTAEKADVQAGTLAVDVTTAVQNAINSLPAVGGNIYFPPGKYRVTTITFANTRYNAIFDGAVLWGSATVATDCVVRFKGTQSNVYGLVIGGWNPSLSSVTNSNYTCALWWYDGANPSQFNNFFGLYITDLLRGVIFGEKPGNTDTNLPLSENSIFGYKTRSVQNPFYGNAIQGFITLNAPELIAEKGDWSGDGTTTGVYRYSSARAIENAAGSGYITVMGGEVVKVDSALGYAADLNRIRLIGTHAEVAPSFQVTGDSVQWQNGVLFNTQSTTDIFVYTSAGKKIDLDSCKIIRNDGTGSGSTTYLVNALSATAPEVNINDCDLREFGASFTDLVALNDDRLARWSKTRLQKTLADTDLWMYDTQLQNLLDIRGIDRMAWTAAGWFINSSATLLGTAADAPTADYTNVVTVTPANVIGSSADESSVAQIRATAVPTHVNELFMLEGWCRTTGAGAGHIIARFYNSAGAFLSNTLVMSTTQSRPKITTSWRYSRGFFKAPASAAYVAIGGYAEVATVRFVDLKLSRCNWK